MSTKELYVPKGKHKREWGKGEIGVNNKELAKSINKGNTKNSSCICIKKVTSIEDSSVFLGSMYTDD